MAEYTEKMAKSPIGSMNGFGAGQITCRYLFHHEFCTQQVSSTSKHVHPTFWHIDVITQGSAMIVSPLGTQRLAAGQLLLIPVNVVHEIRYPRVGTAWFSVKFTGEGTPHFDRPLVVTPNAVQTQLVEAIRACVRPTVLSVCDAATLGHLLAALLTQVCGVEEYRPAQSAFLAQLRVWLAAHAGEAVSVADAARAFGYTPGHASARLKQECGLSLKAFLDEQRAATAERLLIFTDLSISEIAGQLAFPDVYAFSRFFHRMKGVSPRAFRRGSQHAGKVSS